MTRTRIFLMVGLVAVSALLVADVASAQPRGGRQGGRPGFGGGFGGFGGGRGGQFDTFALLRMDAIRTEIELEESQREEIDEVQEKLRDELRQVTAKITSKYEEELEEVLLPHQFERVQEISIQLRGLDALNDPKISGQLKISDAQQKQMEETREEYDTKMREAFGGSGGGFNRDAFEKVREIREERDEAVLAVLSKRQQDQFEKMKGEPFDRQSLFRGRGGGGRGPGGDGNRPRRPGGGDRPRRPDTE